MSPKGYTPDATAGLKVPELHWEDLEKLDPADVCRRCSVIFHPGYGYQLRFLNQDVIVDTTSRCLRGGTDKSAEEIDDPLLLLILLVYLQCAVAIEPDNVMVAAKELKEWHFFTGIHALDTAGVIKKYGNDIDGFESAANALGGTRESYADVSYRFLALPRIPLYYLLWEGDEDFEPTLSICFDRTIERHFAADAIWGLVKRVSRALKTGRAL